MALGVAKTGASRVAALLPAGYEQLQFEITAIFGLAIADIHGMDLGGRPSALTEECRETARSLFDNGANYAEIARILLVSERTDGLFGRDEKGKTRELATSANA
jgi:hypothetical protein